MLWYMARDNGGTGRGAVGCMPVVVCCEHATHLSMRTRKLRYISCVGLMVHSVGMVEPDESMKMLGIMPRQASPRESVQFPEAVRTNLPCFQDEKAFQDLMTPTKIGCVRTSGVAVAGTER